MEEIHLSTVPETQPAPASPLDEEIAYIRSQIHHLTQRRSTLTASVLSSPSTPSLLTRTMPSPHNDAPLQPPSPRTASLKKLIESQTYQDTLSAHRLCTGATMFESHDPDPHAVDNGRIIGVRIEVFDRPSKAFLKPHYLLLHKLPQTSPSTPPPLRIHHHTLPPSVPLSALAAKHLPTKTPQNLPRLVRALRHHLISHQRRLEAIQNLQHEMIAGGGEIASRSETFATLKEIRATDAEATDLRLEWADGRIARVEIDEQGTVEKVILFGPGGKRERLAEKGVGLVGGRVEELGRMLR